MPYLIHLTHNRTLTTTQACYNKFMAIANTIAGPVERLRSYIIFRHHHQNIDLIKNDVSCLQDDPFKNWKCLTGGCIAPAVQVLPDYPSSKLKEIYNSGIYRSFNELHLQSFGSSHKRQMTSLTANAAIARSISNSFASQGPSLSFFDCDFIIIHEPRSFVEMKLVPY